MEGQLSGAAREETAVVGVEAAIDGLAPTTPTIRGRFVCLSDSSIMVMDTRDERIVSPFQCWLVKEVVTTMPSTVSRWSWSWRSILRQAHHVGATATALSHPQFQPFSWPLMRDTSASYVDVKLYNGNEVLFHWVFRAYRSDTDLSVQVQFCDEALIRDARVGTFRPSVVISVFIGWKVSVFLFEVGRCSSSVGPHGTVYVGNRCRSRFELRVVDRGSDDAIGNDAGRVEFRFRDANNRINLKCGRASVPGTWLVVSHISGPALIRMIQESRNQGARVEGPEPVEQFAQIHQAWFTAGVARTVDETGTSVYFVGALEEGNFHIIASSPLFRQDAKIVNQEALAERVHKIAVSAPVGPAAITEDATNRAAEEVRRAQALSSEGQTVLVDTLSTNTVMEQIRPWTPPPKLKRSLFALSRRPGVLSLPRLLLIWVSAPAWEARARPKGRPAGFTPLATEGFAIKKPKVTLREQDPCPPLRLKRRPNCESGLPHWKPSQSGQVMGRRSMSVDLARHFRNVIAWSCVLWSSPREPSDRSGAMCDTGSGWSHGRRRMQPGSILSVRKRSHATACGWPAKVVAQL